LFGPPGSDFPHKIVRAADGLAPGDALPVVDDEHGRPTYTVDLADAILGLLERSPGCMFHLDNDGPTTRLEWARHVLDRVRPDRPTRPVSRHEFPRASDPPPWGVLDTGKAADLGIAMRSWQRAVDAYLEG
jgi:dTDP-4-dehydrorhamnose reductase